MKTLGREAMMTLLEKKGCKVCGTTEQFSGSEGSEGGIWLSGEEGDGLFEYYSNSSRFNCGVLNSLQEAVQKRGWWFEWNDPGTIMCWKM